MNLGFDTYMIGAVAAVTFVILFFGLYAVHKCVIQRNARIAEAWRKRAAFVSDKAPVFLLAFIVMTLLWSWIHIFANPYRSSYNHGNGAYYAQVLHNASAGIGPEQTVKYSTLNLKDNPSFFASAFALSPQILSPIILAPLYRLYPHPPMHVFSLVFVVISFGSCGVYLAIRAMGGSKNISLLGAVGYCLIPWIELPIFFHGAYDNLAYAVYPYVFACLFSKRWKSFYISLVLLALINIAYAYAVIALGAVVFIFFNARRPGVVAILVGVILMLWEMALMKESLLGVWIAKTSPPGLVSLFVLSNDINTLISSARFHLVYIACLLVTVSFLPLYGIRMQKKWNMPVVGMIAMAFVGLFLGVFRSYGITFHRNSNMVVPIYLSAFMVYVAICNLNKETIAGFLLFSCIATASIWGSVHYPWAGLKYLISNPPSMKLLAPAINNEQYDQILSAVDEYVPGEASIAFRVDAGLEAFLANRQGAWSLGENPEGAEYYVIQKKSIDYIDENLPPWADKMAALEKDKNYKLLYRDDFLTIIKNLYPKPIPRLEDALGWSLLWKAL